MVLATANRAIAVAESSHHQKQGPQIIAARSTQSRKPLPSGMAHPAPKLCALAPGSHNTIKLALRRQGHDARLVDVHARPLHDQNA